MPEWDHFKNRLLFDFYCILTPVKESQLACYASVFFEQAFFIFGGWSGVKSDSNIGRLDAVTRSWSLVGSLKQARNGHAVIFDGTQFLVIGGSGNSKTENCVPNSFTSYSPRYETRHGTTITCTEQKVELVNYADYPVLMLVDENYGNNCWKICARKVEKIKFGRNQPCFYYA